MSRSHFFIANKLVIIILLCLCGQSRHHAYDVTKKDPYYSAHGLYHLYRLQQLGKYYDEYTTDDDNIKSKISQDIHKQEHHDTHGGESKEYHDPDLELSDENQQMIVRDIFREYEENHHAEQQHIQETQKKHPLDFFKHPLQSFSGKLGVKVMKDVKPENKEEMTLLHGPLVTWLVHEYEGGFLFRTLQRGLKVTTILIKTGARIIHMPIIIIERKFITYALSFLTTLITEYMGGALLLFQEKFDIKLNELFDMIRNKTQSINGRLRRFVTAVIRNGVGYFVKAIITSVNTTSRFVFKGFKSMFKMVMVYGVRKLQEVIGLQYHAKIDPYNFTDAKYDEIVEHRKHVMEEHKRFKDRLQTFFSSGIRKKAFEIAVHAANEGMHIADDCVHKYLEKGWLEQIHEMVDKVPMFKDWLHEKLEEFFKRIVKMSMKIAEAIFNHAKEAIAMAEGIEYNHEKMDVARIAYKNRLNDLLEEG